MKVLYPTEDFVMKYNEYHVQHILAAARFSTHRFDCKSGIYDTLSDDHTLFIANVMFDR